MARWWSPLNLWVEAVSKSIHWDNAGQRETLEGLCPLWVRRGEDGRHLHLFGPSVHLSPITAHLAASAIWRDYWDARLREQIDSLKASRFADKVILRKLTGWQCRWPGCGHVRCGPPVCLGLIAEIAQVWKQQSHW